MANDNGIKRRVFLRLLSGSALAAAAGGLLAGCGGGGNGGSSANNGGPKTFNFPNVTIGGQAGSLNVTTQPNGATTGTLTVLATVGSTARPRVTAAVPAGTYVFSGTSTSTTGGFTVSGTATYTPSPFGDPLSGPFTLGVTVPTATAAGTFTVTFSGSTYTGTIPPTSASRAGQLGGTSAGLQVGPAVGISGITPPPENAVNPATFIPADIQIIWNAGNIDPASIIEYHVYRDPEPTVLTTGAYLQPPGATNAQLAPIPIISPASPNSCYDSILDVAPIFVQKPSSGNDTALITGGFYATNAAGIPGQFAIPGTGLQIGDRVRYWVEALYTISSNGTRVYALSTPAYTNYVTYLQPVYLRQTVGGTFPHGTTPNPNTDPFGLSTSPNNVTVTVPTVFGNGATLEYALDFSASEAFASGNTVRYTQTVPASGDFELDPRNGPAIHFPNIDLTSGAALTALGTNPAGVYVRIGVRDTRNADTDANYVYTTADIGTLTDPASHTNLLPAPLTPGGGTSPFA